MILRFYLLGPAIVTWKHTPLNITRRQVRKLLYLLATQESAVPLERLHYLFWSDKPESFCRSNLSHLLTHARRSLPNKDILTVTNSIAMLDPSQTWSDVGEFKNLVKNEARIENLPSLVKAYDLYRGPYLDGVQLPGGRELEYVVEQERYTLERQYLNGLIKLIEIETQRGKLENALEYAYKYLEIDNLSEEVHRQLIRLHAWMGNQDRAIRQYKLCEEILAREIQATPSKKTQAMYQEALSGNLSEYRVEKKPPEYKTSKVREIPISQRLSHLDQLQKNFDNFFLGVGGVVLLSGEIGVGKNNLIQESLLRNQNNSLILHAHCDPGSESISFLPLIDIATDVSNYQDKIRFLNPDSTHEIAQIAESISLTTSKWTEASEITKIDQKEYFFKLISRFFEKLLSASNGVILCLEDLEWADENTLDLILHLSSRFSHRKFLFIGSLCCKRDKKIQDFEHHMQLTRSNVTLINVSGYGINEIHNLVKYWIGSFNGSQAFSEKLLQICGGNPYYLHEIVKWIAESGLSAKELDENPNIPIPNTISKTIEARLGRLEPVEREVLEYASLLGRKFRFEELHSCSDLPLTHILDTLDNLVNRHLLVVHSTNYQFRHELIRFFILNSMNPARRQAMEQNFVHEPDANLVATILE